MRVLVIDDSDDARAAVAEVAEAAGMEVVATAASGEEGLQRFAELSPDAVIVDVRMPGLDGYDVEDAIRTRSPETKVVLVSATPPFDRTDVVHKGTVTPSRLRALLA